jgi:hypothetical protein
MMTQIPRRQVSASKFIQLLFMKLSVFSFISTYVFLQLFPSLCFRSKPSQGGRSGCQGGGGDRGVDEAEDGGSAGWDDDLPDIPYTPMHRSEGREEFEVTLVPTLERGATDHDSDDEDDPSGQARHLPRRLLGGEATVHVVKYTEKRRVAGATRRRPGRSAAKRARLHVEEDVEREEEEEEEEEEELEEEEGEESQHDTTEEGEAIAEVELAKWTKEDPGICPPPTCVHTTELLHLPDHQLLAGLLGSKVPQFVRPAIPEENAAKITSCKYAIDFFKLFSTDDWMEQVVKQSRSVNIASIFRHLISPPQFINSKIVFNAKCYLILKSKFEFIFCHLFRLYAVQHGLENKLDTLTVDKLRCVEGMFLHTGYHEVPKRRMVWEGQLDCHNELVAANMRSSSTVTVL